MSEIIKWKIVVQKGKIFVEENGGSFGCVKVIGTSKEYGVVKVTYTNGLERKYCLRNLLDGNGFGPYITSRSVFIQKWDTLTTSLKSEVLQKKKPADVDEDRTRSFDSYSEYDKDFSDEESSLQSIIPSTPVLQAAEVSKDVESTSDTEKSAEKVLATEVKLDKFLIGESIKVHIENLVAPADERLFRALDHKHTESLKQYYKNQQVCHSVMIGNIPSSCLSKDGIIKKLQDPGSLKVEVLGGNHTRSALQSLAKEQENYSLKQIACHVYLGLPDHLALQLGFEHNISNTLGKPTTFFDLLSMFRREAARIVRGEEIHKMSSSETKEWKDQLSTILQMDRKNGEFHNKYKVIIKLAKLDNKNWNLLEKFVHACESGRMKHKPRGSLKMTQMREFSSLEPTEQKKIMEQVLESNSWKIFKCEVERCSGRKKEAKSKTANAVEATAAAVATDTGHSEGKLKESELRKVQTENEKLKANLDAERKKALLFQQKIVDLEIKIENMDEINEELEGSKLLLEKKVEEMEESLKYYMQKEKEDNDQQYGSHKKDKKTESSSKTLKRKRENDEEFEKNLGKEVEAYWGPDKTWYRATILSKSDKDVKVKYTLDGVEKVLPFKHIRWPTEDQCT